ncbi:uncharacterized protein LOC133035330 [Cannabis sativa]|uniref:uncharacterized protein LOC133035330 n=1 Tax=Cannabis sativa TaxID=3483 RepID=UPI0029CA35AD|nr:uncharacterized protein LOC133035330 [Cannabis sativa]
MVIFKAPLKFADDLVIYYKGNENSIRLIHEAFKVFSDSTGLLANKTKSLMYFGGVKDACKGSILNMLQMKKGSFPLKYLGVHLRPTKWQSTDCGTIIDKVHKKLHNWASRNLSFVGRAQLIHSVLLGIRNFWMSLSILPQKVTGTIDTYCRDFLWGTIANRRKFYLPSYEKGCFDGEIHLGYFEQEGQPLGALDQCHLLKGSKLLVGSFYARCELVLEEAFEASGVGGKT